MCVQWNREETGLTTDRFLIKLRNSAAQDCDLHHSFCSLAQSNCLASSSPLNYDNGVFFFFSNKKRGRWDMHGRNDKRQEE